MTEQDVIEQLQDYGLRVEQLVIGAMQRVRVSGSKSQSEPGWYVIHRETARDGRELFFGSYGDWRRGEGAQKIEFDGTGLAAEEREAFARKQEADRNARQAERQQLAAETAKRAQATWAKLPESGASPYLDRKRVRAFGVRFSRGSVVVPMLNSSGWLVGLQFINPEGAKKFMTGTAKQGAFHLIGAIDPDQPVLLIAEGYATAASLHMATARPAVVAFDAGNLLPVAKALRSLYPNYLLVICCDDDQATPGNPGRTKGEAAAKAVGGIAIWPRFTGVSA